MKAMSKLDKEIRQAAVVFLRILLLVISSRSFIACETGMEKKVRHNFEKLLLRRRPSSLRAIMQDFLDLLGQKKPSGSTSPQNVKNFGSTTFFLQYLQATVNVGSMKFHSAQNGEWNSWLASFSCSNAKMCD